MNNAAKILIGFVLGSLVGMSAGLLIAPTTGKQARKKIGKQSKKIAKQVAGYIGVEEKVHGTSKRKNGKSAVEA